MSWDKALDRLGMTATTDSLDRFTGTAAITGMVPLSATTRLHYVIGSGQTSRATGIGAFTVHG